MHNLLSKGGSTTPRSAALQIVHGVIKGKQRVFVGTDAKIVDVLSRYMPWFVHTKFGIVFSLSFSFLCARFIGKKVVASFSLLLCYKAYKRLSSK